MGLDDASLPDIGCVCLGLALEKDIVSDEDYWGVIDCLPITDFRLSSYLLSLPWYYHDVPSMGLDDASLPDIGCVSISRLLPVATKLKENHNPALLVGLLRGILHPYTFASTHIEFAPVVLS
jgi:hypothetical protein